MPFWPVLAHFLWVGSASGYHKKKKKNAPSSCEIEDFVEAHVCKLCVILRSRVLLGECPH